MKIKFHLLGNWKIENMRCGLDAAANPPLNLQTAYLLLCCLLALTCTTTHANAEPQNIWGGDITHFQDHDLALWQSGHWAHQIHDGKKGWWWIIGDNWYLYPSASFPYPDPFIPDGVPAEKPSSSETHYWYYCSQPDGYYPYVTSCHHLWRRVASTTVVVPTTQAELPHYPLAPAVAAPKLDPVPTPQAQKPKIAAASKAIKTSHPVVKKKTPPSTKPTSTKKSQHIDKKAKTLPVTPAVTGRTSPTTATTPKSVPTPSAQASPTSGKVSEPPITPMQDSPTTSEAPEDTSPANN